MDGYNTLSKIREIDRNASVIMITAFPYDHSMKRCLENGAAGYLNKPFSVPEVMRTIQQTALYSKF